MKYFIITIIGILFISCNCNNINNTNSYSYTVDKGILINKTEELGRFNAKNFIFTVLYKNNVDTKYVESNVYNQYNVKDSIDVLIRTNVNNNSISIIDFLQNATRKISHWCKLNRAPVWSYE